MLKIRCSHPLFIVNPSLRHQIRFCSKVVLYDADNKQNIVRNLTRDDIFRVVCGENACSVFHVYSPNDLDKDAKEHYSSDACYDYCSRFFFLTDDGECFDFFNAVPCGHCDICRDSYVSSLRQRVMFALQETHNYPIFVTLTYDKELTPKRGPDIRRVQLFKKKFKETISSHFHFDSSLVKFVVVSENGHNDDGSDNDNLHYHMLILGMPMLSPNQRSNFLISLHLLEYCWRLPEYSFTVDGVQSLNPISFADYCRKYSLITRRPKGYDPFSFGYVHLKQIDSVSKCVNYITKYITKDLQHPEKLPFYKVWNPQFMHGTVKYGVDTLHYNKAVNIRSPYRKNGWRPHFLSVSQNLGMKFIKTLTVREDGKVAFKNWLDGTLYTVNLCSYYINKIFPSFSQLVPPVIRKAYDNVLIEISRCLSSRFLSKPIRKMLLNNSIYVRNNFPFLGDFELCRDGVYDFPCEQEFDSSLSLISKFTSILYAWLQESDLDEMRYKIKLRDRYFSLLNSHSKPLVANPADAAKIREDLAAMRSKSYL